MNTNIQRISKKTKTPIFAALVTAFLASVCCLGPVVLAVNSTLKKQSRSSTA